MRWHWPLVLTGMVLCGPLVTERAYAISRVGKSSIGDREDGFTAPLPEAFVFTRPLANGAMSLLTPNPVAEAAAERPRPAEIRLHRFRDAFPELTRASRAEFYQAAKQRLPTWQTLASSNACVEALYLQTADQLAILMTWGAGRGVVIVTRGLEVEQNAALRIYRDLKLEADACQW